MSLPPEAHLSSETAKLALCTKPYEFGYAKRVLLSKPKALMGLGFGAFRADALALCEGWR